MCKEVKFNFTPKSFKAFEEIKSALVTALSCKLLIGVYPLL